MNIPEIDALGKPYRVYAEVLERGAIDQFIDAMSHPSVLQGAMMPDAHTGYALPIGSVVATKGTIFPSFVGYDIGCGMCAIPTLYSADDIRANAKKIFDQIYRDVPVGFSHNKEVHAPYDYPGPYSEFVHQEIVKTGACARQLGTLGGGNHFIEIGADETDRIWIVIHSGSRNVGHKIATHYMKIASGDGKAREGNFPLDVESEDGKNYINDLAFGLQFALDNRKAILNRISWAIHHAGISGALLWHDLINRNHNHAEEKWIEEIPGFERTLKSVWVHRKGATHAEEGMMGVIPGNMRDGSFVVRGKGNRDSLYSSSHGAGRIMGRKQADRELNMEDFTATMKENGVQALVTMDTLDESPFAYKNIFEVMALQSDLVEVVHHIKPIINIKGAGKRC